jgi:hypothetical protein
VKKANSADSTREIYLKFDLSSLSTINTAKLRLNARLSDTSNASLVTQVFSATDTSWTETGPDVEQQTGCGDHRPRQLYGDRHVGPMVRNRPDELPQCRVGCGAESRNPRAEKHYGQ